MSGLIKTVVILAPYWMFAFIAALLGDARHVFLITTTIFAFGAYPIAIVFLIDRERKLDRALADLANRTTPPHRR